MSGLTPLHHRLIFILGFRVFIVYSLIWNFLLSFGRIWWGNRRDESGRSLLVVVIGQDGMLSHLRCGEANTDEGNIWESEGHVWWMKKWKWDWLEGFPLFFPPPCMGPSCQSHVVLLSIHLHFSYTHPFWTSTKYNMTIGLNNMGIHPCLFLPLPSLNEPLAVA